MGDGLTGKTVGSLGLGNIGSELFRLLAPLDMVHMSFRPVRQAEDAAKLRVRLTDKDTVLRESDIVFVNCPLTPETRRLVSDREFSLMKPTAYFINTARGPIVDEKALYAALVETTHRRRGSRRLRAGADCTRQSDPRAGQRHRDAALDLLDGRILPQQRGKRVPLCHCCRQGRSADVRRQSRRTEHPAVNVT
jgi:hypothetical protein